MRFGSPTARSNLSPLITGFPHPLCSTFRFSQPLDGLLLRLPCGLITYHWHSWGLPFRVFPSKAAPCSYRAWFPPKMMRFVLHLYQLTYQQMECPVSLTRRPDWPSSARIAKVRRLAQDFLKKRSASEDTASLKQVPKQA